MIYLLHFSEPYKHARHYLGYARQLQPRLDRHARGQGARLMAAVHKAGIGVTVARTWRGKGADRTEERRLHNQKNNAALCPLCNGEKGRPAHPMLLGSDPT